MGSLNAGTADTPGKLMAAVLTAYNTASFGSCDGHFESAYAEPGISWLGVEGFVDGEIVEAIRRKAAGVLYSSRVDGFQLENLSDVADTLTATHAGRRWKDSCHVQQLWHAQTVRVRMRASNNHSTSSSH